MFYSALVAGSAVLSLLPTSVPALLVLKMISDGNSKRVEMTPMIFVTAATYVVSFVVTVSQVLSLSCI